MKQKKLAIFAAAGNFSLLAIDKALKDKREFIIVAFNHISEFEKLERYKGIKLYKTPIGYLGHILKILKKENVGSILLVGKIEKVNLFKILKLDITTLKLFLKLKDYSDASLLQGIVDFFKKNKIECLSQKEYFSDFVMKKGFLSKKKCSKKDLENIQWGYEKAKAVADLNIGQSLITGNKVVISVEGIEGTDKMIQRSKPFILKENYFVKVAKKNHNPRFDLPTFGLNTLKLLKQINVNRIGLESDMVMIPEWNDVIEFANKNRMVVYGI